MTDPAPGVGHENKTREHDEDVATTSVGHHGPTFSNPPPTGNDQSHDNDDGAEETTEATTDDDDDDNDDDNDDDDEEEEEEDDEEEDEEDEEDDDGDDDEPRLKYARLTQHLGGVYRNADATSSFLVAGDKMVVGTHNGNIVRPRAFLPRLPAFPVRKLTMVPSMSSNCLPSNPYESTMPIRPLSQIFQYHLSRLL